jgi:hypothetical protein
MALPTPGAPDCSSGFSSRVFGDWTNDASGQGNGLLSPLEGTAAGAVKSLCYAITKAISDELTADAAEIGGGGTGASTITVACDPTVNVGDLVALSGGEAVLASAADIAKLPVVGCVTAKPSSAQATVQIAGLVSGLYSGLALGAMCFVGVNGRPVAGPPAPAPGGDVFLQAIGVALDAATLLVFPGMIISHIYGEPGELVLV